jgi:hypothetical protein
MSSSKICFRVFFVFSSSIRSFEFKLKIHREFLFLFSWYATWNMRCLQWNEFQHENSCTWKNVRVCEMSTRSSQKREERWFRVFVKSVQWFEFAMFIFSFITSLHRWEIVDCARTCFDELSSSERLSIQILRARRKLHAKHSQNNTSSSLFIVRIASFNIEIRISIDERKWRAASFRANSSSSTQARRNLIEIFYRTSFKLQNDRIRLESFDSDVERRKYMK